MTKLNAVERARQLMLLPQTLLPPDAMRYIKFLAAKYGGCGEVYLTALAHYAQAVEGYVCDNEAYRLDDGARTWFRGDLRLFHWLIEPNRTVCGLEGDAAILGASPGAVKIHSDKNISKPATWGWDPFAGLTCPACIEGLSERGIGRLAELKVGKP